MTECLTDANIIRNFKKLINTSRRSKILICSAIVLLIYLVHLSNKPVGNTDNLTRNNARKRLEPKYYPPSTKMIFHNKMPKSGSTTMHNLLKRLAEINGFDYVKIQARNVQTWWLNIF